MRLNAQCLRLLLYAKTLESRGTPKRGDIVAQTRRSAKGAPEARMKQDTNVSGCHFRGNGIQASRPARVLAWRRLEQAIGISSATDGAQRFVSLGEVNVSPRRISRPVVIKRLVLVFRCQFQWLAIAVRHGCFYAIFWPAVSLIPQQLCIVNPMLKNKNKYEGRMITISQKIINHLNKALVQTSSVRCVCFTIIIYFASSVEFPGVR